MHALIAILNAAHSLAHFIYLYSDGGPLGVHRVGVHNRLDGFPASMRCFWAVGCDKHLGVFFSEGNHVSIEIACLP